MIKRKLTLNPLAMAIALISGSIAIPQVAIAQDEAREEEEVLIVSARRRDESLQEVPIALTSFSGDLLDKTGTPDLVELGNSSPNTTLKVSRGTNTTLTAFIRGIGQADPLAGFESGVGLYIDDVYLNRPQGAVLDVYDVERVEILRGPQGTLYGRNTIGGAIKYVTKRLSNDPALSIKGSIGTYNQRDIIVTGSIPFADDTIKIGASIASFNRDGFGKNIETGEEHYNKDITAARASIEFTPTDDLYIRLAVDHTNDQSSPKPGYRTIPSVITLNEDGSINEARTETDAQGNIYEPLDDVYDTRAGATFRGHPINENIQTAGGSALSVEWNVSDELTFKSTTAYREDEQESIIDFDGLPGDSFDAYVVYENDQTSQEFQLLYEGEKVQGIAGLYYLDANALSVFDLVLAPNTILTFGDVNTDTWAIFTDLNIDLSDTVALSLGARYTEDTRTAKYTGGAYLNTNTSPYFGGEGTIAEGFVGERTDSAFTPKISFSWQPTDEVHLYLGYSQGFKGGSFDPRGDYSQENVQKGFAPEFVDSYELGIKSSLADGLITSNLAFFYSDYTDVQVPASIAIDTDGDGINDNFTGTVTNAGRESIIGAEFELTANFTDSFKTDVSIGLIDADYREYILNGVDVSSSRTIQNTPETTAGLRATYEISVGPGELSLIGSANYNSFVYQTYQPVAFLDQPGYTLVNASIVWTSDSDHWQASLHGLNLTDKEYIVAGYNFALGQGSASAFYGNPRTVTAKLKYSF